MNPGINPCWLALGVPVGTAATGLTAPLLALGWWSLQFTPWVAHIEDALVLEISASERLFGGRQALLQVLLDPAHAPLAAHYGHGDSALLALARLRIAPLRTPEALAAPVLAPDDLPVHTLAAAQAHLPTLERLGCRTWGQLRALPRGGVARRFGAGVLSALDQAYGSAPETYAWLRLPEVFEASLELAAQVESAPALLFGARRLLAQLQVWLRARQHGVQALELRWQLDARRANAQHYDAHHSGAGYGRLEIRTAQATPDPRHLERLLAERLAHVKLPAPVLVLALRSLQTCALPGQSQSLLPETLHAGDSLQQLLERVVARLGPASVLLAQLHSDHRPECMQRWHSPDSAKRPAPARDGPATAAALYPNWLLAAPQGLGLTPDGSPLWHGPLALLAGPQRLELQAWDAGPGVQRDYYIARSQAHGLVWVYCERMSGAQTSRPQWYLHGVFG